MNAGPVKHPLTRSSGTLFPSEEERGGLALGVRLAVGLGWVVQCLAGSVEPLPNSVIERNAGLFVGVNQYSRTNFTSLKYAVNDAVAQAEAFALRLKIIPPQNTFLLISGAPTGTNVQRLERLHKAGIRVIPEARSETIQESLATVLKMADRSNSLVVTSFSGHGHECGHVPYFVPQNGIAGLPTTFISLADVKTNLDARSDRKRWLFVDACRLELFPASKGAYQLPEVTERFRRTFEKASGRVVFASCDAGQVSLEDDRAELGVFTATLLKGIENPEVNLDSPFITIGQVVDYASRAATQRARDIAAFDHRIQPGQVQRPWYEGPGDALSLPIAVSPDAQAALAQKERRLKSAKVRVQLARMDNEKLFKKENADSVEGALDTLKGPDLDRLVNKVESLLSKDGDDLDAFLAWWLAQTNSPSGPKTGRRKGEEERQKSERLRSGTDDVSDLRPLRRIILLSSIGGLTPAQAACAVEYVERALQRCANVQVRRLQLQADEVMISTNASQVLAEYGGDILVSIRVTPSRNHSAQLNYAGTYFDNQIWNTKLSISIAVAEGGQAAIHYRTFLGQATFLSGRHVEDGTESAIIDAIQYFADDAEFLGQTGLKQNKSP